MAIPTAQSCTVTDLSREITSLRITALTADDTATKQAALDVSEVWVSSLLACSALPEYASLSATGQAAFAGWVLRAAVLQLKSRIKDLEEGARADRETLRQEIERARDRGALAAVGEAKPASFLSATGPALVFRPGTSDEGGTMWGR